MRTKRESREVWAKRVERWKDSGLTCKEFCAETGINPRTLTYWKYQFGKGASAAPRPSRLRRSKRQPRQAQPTFVELSPRKSRAEDGCVEVTVRSVSVRVPSGADADLLRQVMEAVERLR